MRERKSSRAVFGMPHGLASRLADKDGQQTRWKLMAATVGSVVLREKESTGEGRE